MATSNNPKHVFDFEGILNMNADPKHWKKLKKQLEEAFGELKIAIQDGLAEEEAQRIVDQFNKIFRQAKLPEIGVDDLRNDFARLEVNAERAAAAINNIGIDGLEDILNELKLINAEVEKIANNKGGIKLFDDDNLKKVMGDIERIAQAVVKTTSPLVRSVAQIDQAIARAKLSAEDVQEALNYEVKTKGVKRNAEEDAKYFAAEYKRAKEDPDATWEEQYYWLVKFNKAYETFLNKQKDPAVVANMEKKYGKLYGQIKAGDTDRRNMLQNIVNRGQGKELVGYTKEPWAHESTLKEIKSILQGGLIVKGDSSNNASAEAKNDVSKKAESAGPEVSIDLKGLEEILTRITYKVKVDIDTERITADYLESVLGQYDRAANEAFESLDGSQLQSKLDVLLQDAFAKVRDVLADGFDENDVEKAFKEYEEEGATDLPRLRNYLKKVVDPNIIASRQNKPTEQPAATPVNLEGANITVDNTDVVAEIKNSERKLGNLVAQEDTLKAIKDSMGNIQVTPDNSEILSALKTLAQNLLNLAQEDTLQEIKNDGTRLTREDITVAVKEGVYAKELAGKYRTADKSDVIDPRLDGYYNNITGVLHATYEEASREFNKFIRDRYVVPKDKTMLDLQQSDFQLKSDVLSQIIENSVADEGKWAQVIVEAINTQGGKIVESIKLLLPQEIVDSVDEAKLVEAFNVLTQAIDGFSVFSDKAKSFFKALKEGKIPTSGDLGSALETLGLVSGSGSPRFKMANVGGLNNGVAIGKDVVYHATDEEQTGALHDLMEKQNRAHEAGAAVARIIAAEVRDGLAFQLQTKVPGANLRQEEGAGFINATSEQIDRLLYTLEVLEKEGLVAEFRGDNVMYDEKAGFSIIDLSSKEISNHAHDSTTAPEMLREILNYGMANWQIPDSELNKFRNKVRERAAIPAEDRLVNADTIAAEKARERAAVQAAARQKGAQGINVAVDNSDVVEAINKLDQNLGTMVAQEDTLQAIKNEGVTQAKEDKPIPSDWVQAIVQAIKDNPNSLTKEDVAAAIKESVSVLAKEDVSAAIKESITALTKEDIVAAIKESLPQEEASEDNSPWALESTLNSTIKNILEKIQANTAKLNTVEIKQAVETNTQATQQAAGIVSNEIQDASSHPDLDKVIRKQDIIDGTAVTTEETRVRSEQTDNAFRTVKDHLEYNDDGEPQLIFREVIDDLKKLRNANEKDNAAIAKAQKKVNEFLAKFESKTGGTAKFIPGFSELKRDVGTEGFINKDNIEAVANRMLDLQKEYAKLETNFRKGQSSLNPFVNAINKAQNIENTFGAVEIRFNGLIEKSEELTSQFNKLRMLSGEIKTLTERMNTDPNFSTEDFQRLSVLMGDFTTTKNQVDGLLKNEAKINKSIVVDQKARVQEWVKLSKQLGVLDAKINSGLFDEATVEQAKKEAELVQKKIDAVIAQVREPSDHLVPVGNANVAAENKTVNAQMSKRIGVLAGQYEQLGKLQAQAENAGAISERERYEQLKRQVEAETEQIGLNKEENAGLLEILRSQQEVAYVNEKDLTIAKDRKKLFEEWIELVRKISALDAKIESGLFDDVAVENAKAARGALSKQIDAIIPQLDLTREDYIYAGGISKESEDATVLAQRQKLFKELAADYIKLGEAQAKSDVQKTRAAQTLTEQLTQEILAKRAVLNLSEEELNVLEAIGEQARANKAEVLSAKDRDKAVRAALQNQKKLSKRRAMVGKAGSAIGRADNVWLEVASMEDELPEEFLDRVSRYEKKLDALKVKHNKLSNSPGPITKKQREQLIEQTVDIDNLTRELGELINQYQRLSGVNTEEIGLTALEEKDGWEAYKRELTEAVMKHTEGAAKIKGFNWETKSLTYTVKTGAHEFTEYTAAVRELDKQMVAVQGSTKRTETFLEATKRKMGELSSYMSGMALFSRASQEIKKGIQYVREIDLALTELKKVTDETEESYDKFLKTAAKTGARLGTTISAVTEATATFAKLGYSMEQATDMAEAAIVYKNVGDNIESTEDAADSIISTMKGFKLEATESMSIVDRFNEVGNRFAITSKGIGEALRLSASALSEGGNSLDESIGLITAANEVVNDPSSVGTALKTLTLRLRGSKTELEEMGEDVSDMATTTSQLQAKLLALTGGQVDIMADANTFKNSTQILREMAAAWEDMTDIQRAEWCPYVQKCA